MIEIFLLISIVLLASVYLLRRLLVFLREGQNLCGCSSSCNGCQHTACTTSYPKATSAGKKNICQRLIPMTTAQTSPQQFTTAS